MARESMVDVKTMPEGPLQILHCDSDLIVVNKPSGMLVHRGMGQDPIVAVGIVRRTVDASASPVHRLDRATSGALVFARSAEIAEAMGGRFERGEVDKRYLALVRGITPESGEIDHPIPRRPDGPRVPAVSRFRRLFVFERYSLVEVAPLTGRLHQIRRHMKHITHPLIGDVRYGRGEHNRLFRERFGLFRLALHAVSVSFDHPTTGQRIRVVAPIPEDLAAPLRSMGAPLEALDLGV